MQIECPQCGFARQVNDSQIPKSSSFATCPKCATRFRFRADPQPDFAPEDAPAPAPEAGLAPPQEDQAEFDEPKEGDIWASMDKMRQEWDEIDREESSEEEREPDAEARLREEAARAYRQAAQAGRIPFLSEVGSVPWEYRGGFLNPLAFVRTIILMLARPAAFFAGINPLSSIVPAWVFLLVARGVQMGVAIFGTNLVHTLPDGTQQIVSIAEVFNVPMLAFVSVCMITIMHFLGSFIVNYTILLHTGPRANFRLTFKVMAYANMPILLTVLPEVGAMLGLFASLLLLFFGIRYAYGFSWRKTVISIMPYLLLSILFIMMILQAATGVGAGAA